MARFEIVLLPVSEADARKPQFNYEQEKNRDASLHKALRHGVLRQDPKALEWLSTNVLHIKATRR